MAISEKIANLVVIHCTHILDIVFDTHCRVQTQTTVFILKLTPRCYLKFSIDLNILDLGKKPIILHGENPCTHEDSMQIN